MAPGVRLHLLRDVRLVGQGVHDTPGLRDAQSSAFLREPSVSGIDIL